jgi:hypothetical protein
MSLLEQLPVILSSGFQNTHPTLLLKLVQYTNLKNQTILLNLLKSQKSQLPQIACIDSTRLVSKYQLQVACTKALLNLQHNALKTHSIHSEFLHMLGPDNSVSQSFKRFGLTLKTTDLIVIFVTEQANIDSKLEILDQYIEGTRVEELVIRPDILALRKVFFI